MIFKLRHYPIYDHRTNGNIRVSPACLRNRIFLDWNGFGGIIRPHVRPLLHEEKRNPPAFSGLKGQLRQPARSASFRTWLRLSEILMVGGSEPDGRLAVVIANLDLTCLREPK